MHAIQSNRRAQNIVPAWSLGAQHSMHNHKSIVQAHWCLVQDCSSMFRDDCCSDGNSILDGDITDEDTLQGCCNDAVKNADSQAICAYLLPKLRAASSPDAQAPSSSKPIGTNGASISAQNRGEGDTNGSNKSNEGADSGSKHIGAIAGGTAGAVVVAAVIAALCAAFAVRRRRQKRKATPGGTTGTPLASHKQGSGGPFTHSPPDPEMGSSLPDAPFAAHSERSKEAQPLVAGSEQRALSHRSSDGPGPPPLPPLPLKGRGSALSAYPQPAPPDAHVHDRRLSGSSQNGFGDDLGGGFAQPAGSGGGGPAYRPSASMPHGGQRGAPQMVGSHATLCVYWAAVLCDTFAGWMLPIVL